MFEIVIYWLVTLLIGLITGAIIYARWNYGTLEKLKGLPAVIKPAFIGGSDPFIHKKIVHAQDTENVKKYGSVFGYYEGRDPQIYIADANIIRLILIKDFDHFHNHRIMELGHPLVNEMMDVLPYDKWKVVRQYLSPQLTTGKLKQMHFQMLDAINDWFPKLKNEIVENGEFNPKKIFSALTTDVIARCAFGTKINAFDNPDHVFVKYIRKMSLEEEENYMLPIVLTFPFLMKLTPIFPSDAVNYFGDLLKTILDCRRKSNQEKVNDFVNVMNEMIDKCDTSPEYKKLGITEITVISQAFTFLIAGYETTSTTLSSLSYHLAKNPEVQDKLIEELDAYFDRHDDELDHSSLGELVYLNACITETLRINSLAVRLERVCVKDWYYEPMGLTIRKDMVVQFPVYAIHFNEEYYPDPHQFKPERFLAENKDKLNPYAFLSFGQGPHNCIGMRFARDELQMALASVLKEFRFETTKDSELKDKMGKTFLNVHEPFNLKLCQRK